MKSLVVAFGLSLSIASAASPLGVDSIRLPQGYSFEHHMGTDSYGGTISKEGGLVIHMDSGIGVAPLKRDKERYLWFREIAMGNNQVELAMSAPDKSLDGPNAKRILHLYYPAFGVGFDATIDSDADIAEFIAILSTYVPTKK